MGFAIGEEIQLVGQRGFDDITWTVEVVELHDAENPSVVRRKKTGKFYTMCRNNWHLRWRDGRPRRGRGRPVVLSYCTTVDEMARA